jgi:adenylosuccinate synthase
MQKGKFNTLVDSAWGSSGKGAASVRLIDIHQVGNASSGNYPNAGHTAIVNGHKFISKALPTAAILRKAKNQRVKLWIGPNSGFEMAQIDKELTETGFRPNDPDLFFHERAMVVEGRHIEMESPTGSTSTEHISSTMSGSGAAFSEKLMRRPQVQVAKTQYPDRSLAPTPFMRAIRTHLETETFLHEVSQGWALSVNQGTHYPHCTFRDCTPQQAYADFSITPNLVGDVYLNVRSFPIRVGSNFRDGKQVGYSGDVLEDQKELTWEEVARGAEFPESELALLAERERTTVTKKIRRVFTPSWQLLKDSADSCGATKLILNFPQYIHWSAHKVRGGHEAIKTLHPSVRAYIDQMQEVTNLPVCMVGTGADHDDFIFID